MLTMGKASRYPLEQLKARTHLTDPELADRLGITERHLLRLKATGLSPLQADRYAIACGWHPCLIWVGWDGDRDVLDDRDAG